jgi:predicted component of type VI protein secretion system
MRGWCLAEFLAHIEYSIGASKTHAVGIVIEFIEMFYQKLRLIYTMKKRQCAVYHHDITVDNNELSLRNWRICHKVTMAFVVA